MYKNPNKEKTQKKTDDRLKETSQMFIKGITENNAPWQKGWNPAIDRFDHNMFTMKDEGYYKGYNSLLLMLTRNYAIDYTDDPRWFTYKELTNYNCENIQDKKEEIVVRKGEHGTPISFYKIAYFDKNGKMLNPLKLTKEELENQTVKTAPILRNYIVFNASQTGKYIYDENGNIVKDKDGNFVYREGFTFNLTEEQKRKAIEEFKPKYKIEDIIKNTGAKIIHNTNNKSFFDPSADHICLPQKERFESAQEYYQTLSHELIHWAGDKRRLARDEARLYSKDKDMHAKEELIAEIGSYLLCREAEFMYKPSDRNKEYVKSWCSQIEDKACFIEEATKSAQRAVNYVMDFTRNRNKNNENANKITITNLSADEKRVGRKNH